MQEDRAVAPAGAANGNGAYYDNEHRRNRSAKPSLDINTGSAQRPHGNMDSPNPQDRQERSRDPGSDNETRPRTKRRPSGQQRTCGKCQKHLTGQFVRALGDTFHLECFTCNVGSLFLVALGGLANHQPRIAAR